MGISTIMLHGYGLPISVKGIVVYVSIYPPLLICTLLSLCFGWWWGAIPAYLATFSLAVYSGVPYLWAGIFGFVNPLGLAVLVIGYQAIPMRRDLRTLNSFLFFIQLSFISSIFSSSGALIWCYLNHIDDAKLLPTWQGWCLGNFLQSIFFLAPILFVFWPRVHQWQNSRPNLFKLACVESKLSLLRLLFMVSLGVLIYGFVTLKLADSEVESVSSGLDLLAKHAVYDLHETTWFLYWILATLVVFIAFFGFQLFIFWQKYNDLLLDNLHTANLNLGVLADTDGLTNLLNRRAIEVRLRKEWIRFRRFGHNSVLIILDIDHFKFINDNFGHQAGDDVIRSLALLIGQVTRDIDFLGRYGGEEFIIILPDTNIEGAFKLAERLRLEAASLITKYNEHTIRFTISLGLAVSNNKDADYQSWLMRADHALYKSKQSGRNQSAVAK